MLATHGLLVKPEPPWAGLAVLCPRPWLPKDQQVFDTCGTEDYCICFLRSRVDEHRKRATFPGGSLSSADRYLAKNNLVDASKSDEVFLGLRLAAIRRTFEAAGIMVAANPPPSFARQELQKILLREGPMAFHAFLDDWGIRLRPEDLFELSWFLMPGPHGEEHIFLVQIPDADEACWANNAGSEAWDLAWATPSDFLEMHRQQELELTLAQWYVIHELASSLPRFCALPDLAKSRSSGPLWWARALPLSPASSGAGPLGEEESCFLLPGDEHHEGCPGRNGERHRFWMKAAGPELRVQRLERNMPETFSSRL